MIESHEDVNEARDALVHHLENAQLPRAEAFLVTQAIERFIAAKLVDLRVMVAK